MPHNPSNAPLLKFLLCYLLWIGGGQMVKGQILEDSMFMARAHAGLNLTYNGRYDEADQAFEGLLEDFPAHPAPHFLKATNRWWQSSTCVTPFFHSIIDQQLRLGLEKSEQYLAVDHPDEHALFQYLSHALHAKLAAYRQEWFTAANRGRKLIPYLDDCIAYSDSSVEFCFASGVYHYYAATIAESNVLLTPFMAFFPDGNVSKGLEELEESISSGSLTRPEAMYYLTYIYLEPSARDTVRAQVMAQRLHRDFPLNPWFTCEYARVKVHTGFHEEAIPVLDQLIANYEGQPGAIQKAITCLESNYTTKLAMRAYHYRGLSYLDGRHDPERAIEDFQSSLDYAALCGISEDHYVAGSWYYQGRCHEELEQVEMARNAYLNAKEADAYGEFGDRINKSLKRLAQP